MNFDRSVQQGKLFLLVLLLFSLSGCGAPEEEAVDLHQLLPEGAVTEITHGHPDFAVKLVSEEGANVSATFGEQFLRVEGVEDEELRERLAVYVVKYIENPNRKEEERARREAYKKLPPKEKMKSFVERMRSHYPDFDYEWTRLGEGNVKVEYGDNSLLIKGVPKDGAKEEIAHGIMRIQKEIDSQHRGEQKE